MKTVKLGDIIKLEYGKPLPHEKRYPEGRYAVYGANGVKSRSNEYLYEQPSIIVGRKGSAGELTLAEDKFWPLDVTYFVTHDESNTDLIYIYHLLKTLKLPLLAKGVKPGINRNDIYSISVQLPPLEEQRGIVTRLETAFEKIDRAIELTEKNIKNADQLFDSYLKNIFDVTPESWVSTKLKEVTSKIGSGATPKGGKKSYKTEGISLIRSMNVHDREFKYDQLAYIDEIQAEKLQNVTLEEGDVLLNITGASIARCNVVPLSCLPGRVNQHVSIIRLEKGIVLPEFLHLQLISTGFKSRLLGIGNGNGSTRQAITKSQIEDLCVFYPPSIDRQREIISKTHQILAASESLNRQYKMKKSYLLSLRQSMLHQAFSPTDKV